MELKNDDEEHISFSVLQGDEFCISRILAREVSKGQSSRIFYRSGEGVPFEWEMNPGTPKNPQEEDQIPPVCPSPLMQSLGLPLPNLDIDDHEAKESALKMSVVRKLRKMVKKNIVGDISKKVEMLGNWRGKKHESSRFGDSNGEFVGSIKGSSFSSNSSFSTFSSNSRVVDMPTVDGPFCCNPLDVRAILDEGNTKIYYCPHHRTAFAVEEDDSFLSRIHSRVSTSGPFSGPLENEQTPAAIPFRWEMQPGTPQTPPENELIPPPSPPPAVQSLALPRPGLHDGGEKAKDHSAWRRADRFWRRNKKKESENVKSVEASFRRSGSASSLCSVASKTRGWGRVVKFRRGSVYGSIRDFDVLYKRKLKSFKS